MPLYVFRCSEGHRFDRFLPLARYDEAQNCDCGAPSRKIIVPTMITKPFDEPIQSMADGKYYSDAASLERTYKASGNPQGVEYDCIGDEKPKPFTPPKKTREQEEATDRAISRALDEAGF